MPKRTKLPDYHFIQNNPYGIKVGLKGAEGTLYNDKRYDDVLGTISPDCHCIVCGKMPQTVCEGCIEYLCEDHLFRHPDCEHGR